MLFRFIGISVVIFLLLVIERGFCTKSCPFTCSDNGKCLRYSRICNGIADCPNGSDESFVKCKVLRTLKKSNVFTCANGAEIRESKFCNRHIDCVDESDEHINVCKYLMDSTEKIIQGECKMDEMMCTPEQCISQYKMCDGELDCFNGRDESVKLCLTQCQSNQYQCANGKCIPKYYLCDNINHCIDGSDEIPNMCEGYKKWVPKQPAQCVEPIANGLLFSTETKYLSDNATKFVYANQPVQFTCYDKNTLLIGEQWNVCNSSSQWHFPMPVCNTQEANSYDGCPINSYDNHKANLRIYKCSLKGNNCTEEVIPPINNMRVMFACENEYTLHPMELKNAKFHCLDKHWSAFNNFPNPECVKMCPIDRLYCQDAMIPSCKYNKRAINCNNLNGLPPGTEVSFRCRAGYKQLQGEQDENQVLKCGIDGTWTGVSNMNRCTPDCGKTQYTSLAGNEQISSWTVAIFLRNQNTSGYNYKCAGVLLRHNLVLTAGHCVWDVKEGKQFDENLLRIGPSSSQNSTVDEHFGWSVYRITMSSQYEPDELLYNLAIIQLKNNPQMEFGTICLQLNPSVDRAASERMGKIFIWNVNKTSNGLEMKMIFADHELRNIGRNQRICSSHSGSGFIDVVNGVNYLWGIVSSRNWGEKNATDCTNDVAISRIGHMVNMDFIQKTIDESSNECDL